MDKHQRDYDAYWGKNNYDDFGCPIRHSLQNINTDSLIQKEEDKVLENNTYNFITVQFFIQNEKAKEKERLIKEQIQKNNIDILDTKFCFFHRY